MGIEYRSGDVMILYKSKYYVPKYLNLFSYKKFGRNDVMVYQFANEMFFLKRCAGISGDTIDFRNNQFLVNGYNYMDNFFVTAHYCVKSEDNIQFLQLLDSLKISYDSDEYISCSKVHISLEEKNKILQYIHNGSLIPICGKENYYSVIPYRGYKITFNDSTYNLYKDVLIKYEIDSIRKEVDSYYVNGVKCNSYMFRNNYYYFIGDNMSNSLDSRALGFIPEYLIKGKCFCILGKK